MTTRMHKIIVIAGAALLALALSAALLGAQTSGAPTSGASYVPPSDSISGQSMLELIMRSNRDAIRQARMTVAGTRNSDTRRFAESMVSEQTATLNSATALWDRLNYTRADSVSTLPSPDSGMAAGATADTESDKQYATGQVAALETLSTQLRQRAPLVRDAAVRAFALEVQGAADRQLAAARQLAAPPPATPAAP